MASMEGSQPTSDVSNEPDSKLPLFSVRPAVIFQAIKLYAYCLATQFVQGF